jgi:hypothetical protein
VAHETSFRSDSTIRFRRNGCALYILDLACLIVESNIGSGFGFTEWFPALRGAVRRFGRDDSRDVAARTGK